MYPNEDHEMFACTFKAIKIKSSSNERTFDMHLKFKTDHLLDFTG